jgi:hypothetical protein
MPPHSFCRRFSAHEYRDFNVYWSDWFEIKGFGWQDLDRVLYLYGENKTPYYIGMAGKQTTEERYNKHKTDGVLDRIYNYYRRPATLIKIGEIVVDNKPSSSLSHLERIERFLIFCERGIPEHCRGNEQHKESRIKPKRRPHVTNHHNYRPLLQEYFDNYSYR